MDFVVRDVLLNGREFKVLTVTGTYHRRCLRLEVDTSINRTRVVSILGRLKDYNTLPEIIAVDNRSEFSGKALRPKGTYKQFYKQLY